MSKILTLSDETVIRKIFLLRGKKVMLDRDLSALYSVTTGNLNKAVKRNLKRFPEDFMFQITPAEFKILTFQNGTSSWGGTRKMPYAFTEQGVAMLSSVLNSETAIEVNIQIIRIFTRMREMLLNHKDVLLKLEILEKSMMQQGSKMSRHEEDIQIIFKALKQLLNPPQEPRKKLGFKIKEE